MMKNYILLFIFSFSVQSIVSAQDFSSANFTSENIVDNPHTSQSKDAIGTNGFNYTTMKAGKVNTKYSEFGSGFFMGKFIMVSSKKIGGWAKVDQNTNEGYQNLYCLDIKKDGILELPLLFSRIINTKGSEGQVSFSPDEKTIYFTRATEENSTIYKIYKSTLEENSQGNWINETMLDINVEGFSIENPHVCKKGDELYFSSNMPGSNGGYDLYVSKINADGTLSTPKNLGSTINTSADEKYPSLSLDGKKLYFSSNGHKNMGGFDIFKSNIIKSGYSTPKNLGNTINTEYDEVAYLMASKNKGYVSSTKTSGEGSYDIYRFQFNEILQTLEGKVLDLDTKVPLANASVVLLNEEGQEVDTVVSRVNGSYSFDVDSSEKYTILINKEGFEDYSTAFLSDNNTNNMIYSKILELTPKKAVIEEIEEKLMITVENIYFDYGKWNIKDDSRITLNKIVAVLNENPEMKIEINAHTDNRSNDGFNLNLSDKRAASAMQYLIEKGIDANRLISNGYGETLPSIDCKTNCNEAEHQSNRRIEFVVLD